MLLDLIDPTEEVVVFGKRYPVAWPPPRSTTIRALVPTGAYVAHGNKLTHVTGRKTGGRKAGLERYTGHGGLARGGPFKKSAGMLVPVGKAIRAPGILQRLTSSTARTDARHIKAANKTLAVPRKPELDWDQAAALRERNRPRSTPLEPWGVHKTLLPLSGAKVKAAGRLGRMSYQANKTAYKVGGAAAAGTGITGYALGRNNTPDFGKADGKAPASTRRHAAIGAGIWGGASAARGVQIVASRNGPFTQLSRRMRVAGALGGTAIGAGIGAGAGAGVGALRNRAYRSGRNSSAPDSGKRGRRL